MRLDVPSQRSIHARSPWDGIALLVGGLVLGAEVAVFVMRTFFCV